MKRQIVILFLIGFLSQYALGQISEGGTPLSFSLDMGREKIPVLAMPSVNSRALLEEDERQRAENPQIPFRFGYAIDVDIDVKKDGTVQFKVTDLPNGMYYLHIYDEINEKPEIRQIMVER